MALILSIGVWAQSTPNVAPLNEGFEQGIPEDWTTIHVSGTIQGNDVVWTTVAGGYNSSSYAAHLYYAQPSGENYLITPQLLPSEGSNNLSFYLYAGNYASDGTTTTLTVEVSTTGVAATDFSNVVYTTTMETFTEYTAVNVDLSAYNGQQIYVAFHVVDQYGSEVFLDDVSGVNILLPACIRPQDLTFSNITETSASLTWTGNATSYVVSYKPSTSETWTDETVTTNSYSFTNLDHSTAYEVKVMGDCGEDGTSEVASATFKTLCPEFSDFPYVEDFESLSENDFGCWIIEADETSANASANWTIYDNAQYAPNGSKFAYMPYNDGAISRMISRKFNLSSLTAPYLTFNYQTRTYDGNTDLMSVFYKTADSEEWIELIAYTTGQTSTTYQEIPLPATATQIMFVGYAHDGGGVILDDISIKNVLCPTPTDVAVSDITKHTATVSWQSAEDVNSFSIQYKLDGDEDWTTVETENTTSPYTLTNLLADTNYFVRVGAVCTDETTWTEGTLFRTDVACPAPVVSDTNNTETSVKIFWTETADSYTFRYRPYGENEWTAEETLTETSRILTELLPSTVYEVEVVANCGEEDGTSLPSTITFRTLCSTISSFPYEETFDTDMGCWTTENVSGQYTWLWTNDQNFGPVVVRPYAVGQSLLVSPVFDMSALTSPALSFTFLNPIYENKIDTLGVYYKTNANEDWQYLASYSDSHTEMTSVTLSLPTPSQTYQIMFLGEGLDGNRVVLDNIKVFDEDDVSINDVEATTSIRLYPNPTTDNVILNVEGMMNEATVTVSDIQGRNVLTQKLSQGQKTLTIETANLQAGFYYVRVIGNNSVLTQKLIKK